MTVSPGGRELAVITGASTGIGAATAHELARRGFHVLAGVRRDRDADAIRGAGHRAADHRHDRRNRFEVNLFGHIAVTQAVLPALIRNQGRVINISSVGGKVAMATYGPYAGTKFALEAVSDSLRRELAPLGVHVIVIEPGAVITEMLGRASATAHERASTMTPEQSRRYGGLVHAVAAQAASSAKSGLPADAAAKVIAKAVTVRKPRTRYTVGRDAALVTRLAGLLPDRALDRVIAAALRPHFRNESALTTPCRE